MATRRLVTSKKGSRSRGVGEIVRAAVLVPKGKGFNGDFDFATRYPAHVRRSPVYAERWGESPPLLTVPNTQGTTPALLEARSNGLASEGNQSLRRWLRESSTASLDRRPEWGHVTNRARMWVRSFIKV